MIQTKEIISDTTNDKSFEKSVELLLSEHTSRTPASLKLASLRRTKTLNDMQTYIRRIQYPTSNNSPVCYDYDETPLLHVTGTKGKGSTACLSECILRKAHKYHTGLFTSPHLLDIRERIRLDGKPVSREEFAETYFTLRERLLSFRCSKKDGEENDESHLPLLPGYFRMMTLMALHIFTNHVFPPHDEINKKKGVDIIIMEVGMGGRYDATNIFAKSLLTTKRPFVCGVTLIDYDHTRILGNTLEKIAWEKGGIFKHEKVQGDEADTENNNNDYKSFFTIGSNTPGVIQVLQSCCKETYDDVDDNDVNVQNQISCSQKDILEVVHDNQQIPSDWEIGLKGSHQRLNAELAFAMCQSLHTQIVHNQKQTTANQFFSINMESNKEIGINLISKSLKEAFWPGRCQTVSIPNLNLQLHCDGAHTIESMKECVKWICDITSSNENGRPNINTDKKILIFNCSHERNPVSLLNYLLNIDDDNEKSNYFFSTVYFCKADSERPSMVSKASAIDLLHDAGYSDDAIIQECCRPVTNDNPCSWQDTLADVWKTLQRIQSEKSGAMKKSDPNGTAVFTNMLVSKALEHIQNHQEVKVADGTHLKTHVCVTGSLYMVGSALEAVGWKETSAPPSYVK